MQINLLMNGNSSQVFELKDKLSSIEYRATIPFSIFLNQVFSYSKPSNLMVFSLGEWKNCIYRMNII